MRRGRKRRKSVFTFYVPDRETGFTPENAAIPGQKQKNSNSSPCSKNQFNNRNVSDIKLIKQIIHFNLRQKGRERIIFLIRQKAPIFLRTESNDLNRVAKDPVTKIYQ